jgi:hypothetical protein
MKCPVCNHEAPPSDLGDPLKCPECGVDYNKALSAKQRNESAVEQRSSPAKRGSIRQRKSLLIMVSIAAIALAGVASAPYVAVYQIQQAAQTQDTDSLEEHIDFPRVREDLKEQVNASITKKSKTELRDNPFAALAMALASGIAEKAISDLVTPSGLVELMKGEKPDKLIAESRGLGGSTAPSDKKPFEGANMRYEGFSKFVIEVPDDNGGAPSQFILRRDLIAWRLTGVKLQL